MALVERYHSSQELKAIISEGSRADVKQDSSSQSHPGNKQGISLVHSEERAKHVGILALEIYFPNTYVGSHSSRRCRQLTADLACLLPQESTSHL